MTEENQIHNTETRGTPRWVILGLLVPTVIAGWALWSSSNATRNANLAQQNSAAQVQTLNSNFDKLQQRLADTEQARAQAQSQLDTVNTQLKKTQGALGHDRKETKQFKDEYGKQIADVQDNVKSVKSELATKASADDLKAISGDVSGIHTDLDSTKQGLQMARSEFGTLIARNHEEIDQLRRMGQRDYFEFTLSRKGDRQKVGNITVELRGTNVGKGLYTLRLGVDDMNLEKKNRSVNEPIFFYTQGSRSSLELVVNKVGKNKVVGYLSIPKTATQVAGK
jgi:outer membrane murein-binding lipoprotein Lpp